MMLHCFVSCFFVRAGVSWALKGEEESWPKGIQNCQYIGSDFGSCYPPYEFMKLGKFF